MNVRGPFGTKITIVLGSRTAPKYMGRRVSFCTSFILQTLRYAFIKFCSATSLFKFYNVYIYERAFSAKSVDLCLTPPEKGMPIIHFAVLNFDTISNANHGSMFLNNSERGGRIYVQSEFIVGLHVIKIWSLLLKCMLPTAFRREMPVGFGLGPKKTRRGPSGGQMRQPQECPITKYLVTTFFLLLFLPVDRLKRFSCD